MTTDSIDTNIVLRYILGDVPEQRKRVANFLSKTDATHYLSNQAILECICIMEITLEMPREEIADLMNLFLTRYSGRIDYDYEMARIAFPYYLNHPKLSWADCALSAEAKIKNHEPLFTFDRKLANQIPNAKILE